jgi:hypothetical protein
MKFDLIYYFKTIRLQFHNYLYENKTSLIIHENAHFIVFLLSCFLLRETFLNGNHKIDLLCS